MAYMKKTPLGTVSASHCYNGVCIGMYSHMSCASLEYDERRGKLVLLVNDDIAAEDGIEIHHVGHSWEIEE